MRAELEKRTDVDTGEIHRYLIQRESVKIGGRWMRAYQDGMEYLAKQKLRGESYRVLNYLVAKAGFSNTLPSKKSIALSLDMKAPSVSRAIKELTGIGVIIKDGDTSILSPYFYWKGNQKDFEATIARVSEQRVAYLTSGNRATVK